MAPSTSKMYISGPDAPPSIHTKAHLAYFDSHLNNGRFLEAAQYAASLTTSSHDTPPIDPRAVASLLAGLWDLAAENLAGQNLDSAASILSQIWSLYDILYAPPWSPPATSPYVTLDILAVMVAGLLSLKNDPKFLTLDLHMRQTHILNLRTGRADTPSPPAVDHLIGMSRILNDADLLQVPLDALVQRAGLDRTGIARLLSFGDVATDRVLRESLIWIRDTPTPAAPTSPRAPLSDLHLDSVESEGDLTGAQALHEPLSLVSHTNEPIPIRRQRDIELAAAAGSAIKLADQDRTKRFLFGFLPIRDSWARSEVQAWGALLEQWLADYFEMQSHALGAPVHSADLDDAFGTLRDEGAEALQLIADLPPRTVAAAVINTLLRHITRAAELADPESDDPAQLLFAPVNDVVSAIGNAIYVTYQEHMLASGKAPSLIEKRLRAVASGLNLASQRDRALAIQRAYARKRPSQTSSPWTQRQKDLLGISLLTVLVRRAAVQTGHGEWSREGEGPLTSLDEGERLTSPDEGERLTSPDEGERLTSPDEGQRLTSPALTSPDEREQPLNKVPAFHTVQVPLKAPSYAYTTMLALDERLFRIFVEQIHSTGSRTMAHPNMLPMLIPPLPWTAPELGGFLTKRFPVLLNMHRHPEAELLINSSAREHYLNHAFRALNALGSVPWRVNTDVLRVAIRFWNSHEDVGLFPLRPSALRRPEPEPQPHAPNDPQLPTSQPESSESAESPESAESRAASQQSKYHYKKNLEAYYRMRGNLRSQRSDINYKLDIARAFARDTFYFPHSIDFRGRAYPLSPLFSYMGGDMSRGLLLFADAKPLGARGLYWLKVHLANKVGMDKLPFEERARFTEQHMQDILASVDNPYDNRWWLQSENPFQTLAACFELAHALRSPDPEKFMSSLPVHQDGTCNGLQHYAALGRDSQGARAVNLVDADAPADVYSQVLAYVREQLYKDIGSGVPIAKKLEHIVSRKVIKQTVMTTVYGVTFIGARDQIANRLHELGLDEDTVREGSVYLARSVLANLRNLFSAATPIQDWFGLCARIVVLSVDPATRHRLATAPPASKRDFEKDLRRSLTTAVAWTSPIGIPAVQPYRDSVTSHFSGALKSFSLLVGPDPASNVVLRRSQISAFPPNFVHSLDATHMMLTCLMTENSLHFAAVHDSYWTHACDVDALAAALRAAFVRIYSMDITRSLHEELGSRYAGYSVHRSLVSFDFLRTLYFDHVARGAASSPVHSRLTPLAVQSGHLTHEDHFDAVDRERERLELEYVAHTKSDHTHTKSDHTQTSSDHDPADEDLYAHLLEYFGADGEWVPVSRLIPPPPPKGDFDINAVLDAKYFFS